MKKYIKISSKGEIDPMAFILVGASSKRDDNTKIGFFGSGLKYSIAFLLREKIPFKVFSSYKEIIIETKEVTFRDKTFNRVVVNDIESSLTTDMGLGWGSWQIIREIYCNSIDEGDYKISIVNEDKLIPMEDKTVFYIEINQNIQDVVDKWDSYFSESRKDIALSLDNVIVEGEKTKENLFKGSEELIIYRKGIQCYQEPTKSLYHYDMDKIEINESRILKSMWSFKYDLTRAIQKSTDVGLIRNILLNLTDTWEEHLQWDSERLYSITWVDVIGTKCLVPKENAGYWADLMEGNESAYLILPSCLITGLSKCFPEHIRVIGIDGEKKSDGEFKYLEKTSRQEFYLKTASEFLEKANYPITHDIHVVSFINERVLGRAFDNRILLSDKLFDHGNKKIVQVIIEEEEHLVGKYADETRAFQDRLFQLLVTSYESKTGIFL